MSFTIRQSRLDQRFSCRRFAPTHINAAAPPLVVVHGSDRNDEEMCRYFSRLGEEMSCVVLAPFFPTGLEDAAGVDPYKVVRAGGIECDSILAEMVEAASTEYGIRTQDFVLYGFSGGAQFAHRYFYLHPRRVAALSIASPGMVTLVDPETPLWMGTADFESQFGQPIDLQALRRCEVQLLVGGDDNEPHMGAGYGNGENRVERIEALLRNYTSLGIRTELSVLPQVAHQFEPLAAAAVPFLREQIRLKTAAFSPRPGRSADRPGA